MIDSENEWNTKIKPKLYFPYFRVHPILFKDSENEWNTKIKPKLYLLFPSASYLI